jgi:hypothetical protein
MEALIENISALSRKGSGGVSLEIKSSWISLS